MIVLGLHFGHDASACVVRDGEVVVCVESERLQRVKKIISLSPEDIRACLDDAGVAVEDIDFCAVTSTQFIEYLFRDRSVLSVRVERHPGHTLPCTLTDRLGVGPEEMLLRTSGWLESVFSKPDDHFYRKLLPDADRIFSDAANVLGSLEHFVDFPLWDRVTGLGAIAEADYKSFFSGDDASHGFHYPVVVNLFGRAIPSYVFSHHVAHLAYAYYTSPCSEAAILSHDGGGHGGGYSCGLFAYGKGNRLYPYTPHHLAVGEIYDTTASRLGLGIIGGAGKLMGLSAYGRPRLYDPRFAGNWYDTGKLPPQPWIEHCIRTAERLGYDMDPLGDPARATAPINADIAASTQRLVEDAVLKAAQSLHLSIARNVGPVSDVCLSGGVALNCPANSLVIDKGPFKRVFVPPAVNDEGLSMGAALALTFNLAGVERTPGPQTPSIAYLGLRSSSSSSMIEAALREYADCIEVQPVANTTEFAGAALAENRIIGWFDGRSEIGPRALGHRSLLAHPSHRGNWERMNRIKSRELWRPLAPAVLEEEAHHYFSMRAMPSYYMLLNSEVVSSEIPAVTHVDGSARVQTVSPACGAYYYVLKAFHQRSGCAVVMNTSFNGPGEPIVETPAQAIQFLLVTELDVLFLPGYRVTRKAS